MTLTRRDFHSRDQAVDPNLKVDVYVKADVGLQVYSGRFKTLDQVDELTDQEVVQMYRVISGDERLAFSLPKARDVIKGDLQIAWYEAMGFVVPPTVTANQEERMAKAKKATAESDAATASEAKPKRVTARSIIEGGLLAGTPDEQILEEVHRQIPDSQADQKHITYYRHYLVKAGKIEKPVKEPKPPKEKKAKKAGKTLQEHQAEEAAEAAAPKKGPAARRELARKAAARPGREKSTR